ncbi:MAG: S8 family serine peptidase [Gemmatimonadaceae bacterium]|nr:S8 family serine peptidase [Gemmatimonadaceae bacterium]
MRVRDGVARLEVLYNTSLCRTGQLQLLADTAPVYDASSGTLRVPVVIRNVGSTAVVAPTRIFFNADSSQFLGSQGQILPGTPDIVATNLDTTLAGGRAGSWRYDTLLAAGAPPQVLAPGATTRRKWLVFAGSSLAQWVRLKLATMATLVGSVPAIAPDSIPVTLLGTLPNLTAPDGETLKAQLVVVLFHREATVVDRARAINGIGGFVVGGRRTIQGDGWYIVRVPTATTVDSVLSVLDALMSDPSVEVAGEYSTSTPRDESWMKPHDGPLWQRSSWAVVPVLASGINQAMERVGAPLAWGCETGSTTVRLGTVDAGFGRPADLAPNIVDVVDPVVLGDHGTMMASIVAAVGNNSRGMSGVMWSASLLLRNKLVDARDSTRIAPVPWWTAIEENLLQLGRAGASIMQSAILRLQQEGRTPLVVLSAGNDGIDARLAGYVGARAKYPNQVVVVGAVRADGAPWPVSNHGPAVDVYAPGEDVGAITRAEKDTVASGTSFAAPIVAGSAGLLLSFIPNLTTMELRSLVLAGANDSVSVSGYRRPLLSAYGALRTAARRPGAPLCGNPVAFSAQLDTIQQTSTITVYAKRSPGAGDFESLSTFTVPGINGAPVYLPHGGKQILVDLGDGLGLHRVAQYTATGWQTLSAPWPIATDSSVSGVTWSSRGWSHDGDTALYVTKTMNPGFLTANVSYNLWSAGLLGATLATRANLPDRWTPAGGGGANTGGVGFAGTLSPTGRFAVTVVTDGAAPGQYRFSKVDLPSGSDSLLFTDVLDWAPQYPSAYAGPAPFFGLTVAEDGSELWYTAPVQNDAHYYGCVFKRYSLTQRQFASVDVLPGNGLTACTPTSFAWQGGAARLAGPRVAR